MRTPSRPTPAQALRAFTRASAAAANHRAIAEGHELDRGDALVALLGAGWTGSQIAERTGLSRQRVSQLLARAYAIRGFSDRQAAARVAEAAE